MIWLLACTSTAPDTQPPDDSADTGPVVTPDGTFCAFDELIGTVTVQRWGSGEPSLSAVIHDRPNPWIGQPTASTDECVFHEYDAALCSGCTGGQLCSLQGECVDPPRTDKDASLVLLVDGEERRFEADELGLMWGSLGTASRFEFTLSGAAGTVQTEELQLLDGFSGTMAMEGSYDQPGELTLEWTAEGGHVGTLIPINHHAGAPTFTSCQAPAEAGSMKVPAEMVDPLSVITGLEFQGMLHGEYAAARLDAGCVQFAVTSQHQVF